MSDMGQTRWLSTEEQLTWRAFLATAQLLANALDRQLQRDAGMTHASYIVLAMLSEAPGRALRMTELAMRSNSSQSRMSHTVARLEERGWVRREKSAEDKRGSLAILTDAGWEVLLDTAPGHVEAVRQYLFDPLSDEQVAQLGEICATVLANLDPSNTSWRHVPAS
jgi:DNA-binding MarR family transcriptional regulator